MFQISDRISLKSNPKTKGRITFIHPPQGGYTFYDVLLDDQSSSTFAEHEIIPELIVQSPWDLLAGNHLGDHRDFSISSTIYKVRNLASNTISTLKASRTLFLPYQFKPLVKFLKSDNKRILIADEVGLGKTIEAGHIVLELASRNILQNALVICSKSLCLKWQQELQNKFNFTFKIFETAKDLISSIESDINSTKKRIFGIVTYEKCRNSALQEIIESHQYNFDLIICDEAHRIRNSETAQHKGVRVITKNAGGVVLMTATPIMTDLKNLYSLIRVLDDIAFYNFSTFNNAVNLNKPFIRALRSLQLNTPYSQIANELGDSLIIQEIVVDDSTIYSSKELVRNLFQNDILYSRVISALNSSNVSLENRVKIQNDLLDLNSLNYLYSRTRRRDVIENKNRAIRNSNTLRVSLTSEELEIYNNVMLTYDDSQLLALMTKKRQMASCIVAFESKPEDLRKNLYNHDIPDSKFYVFQTIIKEVVIKDQKKLIVFAFFKKTLEYLRIKLSEDGIKCELIHGDIKDREKTLDRFQHDPTSQVLLSSEVGSEGIDLQFCDTIVNYDLPWNPMVIEQRIGRIDRVGQKSPIIHIYNLVIKETIEEKIVDRLYARINVFKESIGDLEEILGNDEELGEHIKEGIERLYMTKLSDVQQKELIESMLIAIESSRQLLSGLQGDLDAAFSNDLHFQNEVDYILKNNRYLTKEEIEKFLLSLLRHALPSVLIEKINTNIIKLTLPANNLHVLNNFIQEFKDPPYVNPELDNLFHRFLRFTGNKEILLTLNQEYAYENKLVEYISAFHPLINAASNFFSRHGIGQNEAFKLALKKKDLPSDIFINTGYYFVVLYNLIISKHYGTGKEKTYFITKSITCDVNGDSPMILDANLSNTLLAKLQTHGNQMFNSPPIDIRVVSEIRTPIAIKLKLDENETLEDETIKFTSVTNRRFDQQINYLNIRISRLEQQLQEEKGIKTILQSNLSEFRRQKEKLELDHKSSNVQVSHKLLSINFVEII